MKKQCFGFLVIMMLAGFASTSAVHALGKLPPIPPPENFWVSVSTQGVQATWKPVQNVIMLLSMDNVVLAAVNGATGSFQRSLAVDVKKPHAFRLTAIGPGGSSVPAAYDTRAEENIPPKSITFSILFEAIGTTQADAVAKAERKCTNHASEWGKELCSGGRYTVSDVKMPLMHLGVSGQSEFPVAVAIGCQATVTCN